jgi:hypothetical protein
MALFKRSGYWQDVSPTGAIADFITVFKQAGENRWRIAVLACACTGGLFWVISQEGAKGPPRPPTITFITTFAPGRSDAEIAASNRDNQRFQNYLNGERAKRQEEVRHIYKTIGRVSGMDVDAIDKQAKADDAAAKLAQDRRIASELAAQRKLADTAPQTKADPAQQ